MNTMDVSVPVSHVTVFEDRAHVVRKRLLHFEKGRTRLLIPAVASTLIERTLHAAVSGPTRVIGVHLHRDRAMTTPSVEVHFEAEEPGPQTVRLDYVVSNATWRPRHRAELRQHKSGASVKLETEAVVWQHSGEAWEDVAIDFATDRPQAFSRPPELRTAWLDASSGTRDPEDPPASMPSSNGFAAGGTQPIPSDHGRVRRFAGMHRATVPSTGEPHEVPLAAFEETADLRVTWSQAASAAPGILSVVRNTGDLPLLAGPVELIRRGGTCGWCDVGFVSPGEDFSLDWGPDQELRVSRRVEDLPVETRKMSSWVRAPYKLTICVSHLGSEPRCLRVEEQLPQSRDGRVDYNSEASTGHVKPDHDGRLLWAIDLAPQSREIIEVHYAIERRAGGSA
jgi:uncharacterized protein (TIGR02231 family)